MIQILKNSDCCGCGACVEVCPKHCISMHFDGEGFRYPEVNHGECIDCKLCEKVCPMINQNTPRMPLKVLAAKNKDSEIRRQSSSGGVFSLLAEGVIERGGVVFGARFTDDWQVEIAKAESIEDLAQFRGAKYLQSRTDGTFSEVRELLKQGREVLYSGTPCQIAGLKRFIGNKEGLTTIDFICHGVPSGKVWAKYLDSFASYGAVKRVNFRDKEKRGVEYSLCVEFEKKTLRERFDKNIYLQGFIGDIFLRPSCYACAAKELKSGSDITLADYWGIEYILPEFSDSKGISLVMANSQKGIELLDSIDMEKVESNFEDAVKFNSMVIRSVAMPTAKRAEFFRNIDGDMVSTLKRLLHKPLKVRIKKNFRESLAKFKRALKRLK